jgi:ABC-type Mn2+/Zn2+ transport system ATPase subunit
VPAGPVVALERVTVRLSGETILDNITLAVEPGEFLAILGPNGSGKSTLLRTITGLVEPAAGSVRLFGRPPATLGDLRRLIGYVPQVGHLRRRFPVTAEQVVMMGRYPRIGLARWPRRADREAVREAMLRLDVADLAHAPLDSLSGGQRQRVFLARALVNRPRMLLLDEPTGGLDAAAAEQFHGMLRAMHAEGITILLVSHDLAVVVEFVDRVACLNRRLVAHGIPSAVMGEEVLREMYGCHALFFDHGHSPHLVVRDHDPRRA